jgi:hypothetical protein
MYDYTYGNSFCQTVRGQWCIEFRPAVTQHVIERIEGLVPGLGRVGFGNDDGVPVRARLPQGPAVPIVDDGTASARYTLLFSK